jgi:hypothetical protein
MKTTLRTFPVTGCGTASRRHGRRLLSLLLAVGFLGGAAGPAARAESAVSKEYQVKGAFLFNFAQFVEWPRAVFGGPKTPFEIGILGDDPFGPFLDALAQGETVGDRPLAVRRGRSAADLRGCHILFVSPSEAGRLTEVMAALGDASVLTVGEGEDFAKLGGVIGFVLDGKRVRFVANPDAARSRGLKLGAQLLSLAKIVRTGPRQEDLRHERAP